MNFTSAFRPPKNKICTGCKKEKPLKEYYLNSESRDGRHSKCRDCLRTIEDQKKTNRKEKAKTFFDAKYFTLFFLLSTSTAFSQVADTTAPLREYDWSVPTGYTVPVRADFLPKPDTSRAIILVTLSPNGIAHARMGFIVREPGRPVVYLDCRKRALKWPQVGWDWREVNPNNK